MTLSFISTAGSGETTMERDGHTGRVFQERGLWRIEIDGRRLPSRDSRADRFSAETACLFALDMAADDDPPAARKE